MIITFCGNFTVGYSSESQHAKTLESLGHQVIRLQEGEATGEEILEDSRQSDVLIFIHTHGWFTPGMPLGEVLRILKQEGTPTLTYHLDLWKGLHREQDLEDDPFYKQIGHFFATDKLMADWFNDQTEVEGHYLPAGVFHEEATMLEQNPGWVKDVAFVGSRGYHPEWPYRPLLIDWLKETYGDRFGHYSGEQEAIGLKRGLELNQLFADTKVVVGDSLCIGFDYPWYWSDRVYETLGRGGFLIMPYIQGMEQEFEDGKHLVNYEYGDFKQLKYLIDYYLDNPKEREAIRRAGHEQVKNNYTYLHRWKVILDEINRN